MTTFELQRVLFNQAGVSPLAELDPRFANWPVVYTLQGQTKVYVGETLNAAARLRQHLDSVDKRELDVVQIILDESFNKSVCLDLESYLIRLFSGDGQFEVLNRNIGITNAAYYNRSEYQARFQDIFESLRQQGLFSRSIPDIENDALFKLSPFKALTNEQAAAVEEVVGQFFGDVNAGLTSSSVIEGNPGTGKTVVGVYLLKLLCDIASHDVSEPVAEDSFFAEFFTPHYVQLAKNLDIALVVPQQSLRESIRRIFQTTAGLHKHQVLSPFEVGAREKRFDLLVVDEAHRLNQRANQPSAAQNRRFTEINLRLFGNDDASHTQLDWIISQSDHQILLLDKLQTVRPADLPIDVTRQVVETAKKTQRWYPLSSQMRIRADEDYVGYVRRVLDGTQGERETFAEYDLQFFDNLVELYELLAIREKEVGLSRLVAGYAWDWASKKDPYAIDISIDGLALRWNSKTKDWVTSTNAFSEVGSIHTVQGYDLNYAGVIIGPDLRYDPQTEKIMFVRSRYFDKKGKENNPTLGRTYSDMDLRQFVLNIYSVLLTRGIYGTYIYVCDPQLRAYLRRYF